MFSGRSAALVPVTIFRAADAPAQPLTLTVEQTAVVLGVSRSTTYELVGSGDPEIRLRRRIVVPVAHLAERLGVSAGEVWAVVARSVRPRTPGTAPSRKSHERVELTAGHGKSRSF